MSFHSRVTLRASDYAPPDTGVSGLQLVAIEYLPSIEGAGRICRSAPFCGEIIFICSVLICKIIRHYGNIAIYAKHSTLRYDNPPIPKEALAHPSHFWYPETSWDGQRVYAALFGIGESQKKTFEIVKRSIAIWRFGWYNAAVEIFLKIVIFCGE